MRINTSHDYPPIPIRSLDWSATYDDYDGAEDSHCPIGHGATEQEAIADLTENHPRERDPLSIIPDVSSEDPIDLLDQFNDCLDPGGHVYLREGGKCRCVHCGEMAL